MEGIVQEKCTTFHNHRLQAQVHPLSFILYSVLGGGGRVGAVAVVRALSFNPRGWGLIPELNGICGFSLLVLYSASRGFSLGTPVFPIILFAW